MDWVTQTETYTKQCFISVELEWSYHTPLYSVAVESNTEPNQMYSLKKLVYFSFTFCFKHIECVVVWNRSSYKNRPKHLQHTVNGCTMLSAFIQYCFDLVCSRWYSNTHCEWMQRRMNVFTQFIKVMYTVWEIYEVWSKNKHYLKFFKKHYIYLSTTNLSCPLQSQTPSDIIHLCQRFFQSSKHAWNALFDIANSFCCDFFCISSIVAKHFPFGKRKK